MITLLLVALGWLALVGAIILFFQLILILFFGHHGDFSASDADMTGDSGGHDGNVDDDGGVKIFSFLGLSSFLFMFGLVGRYLIIGLQFHWAAALIVATVIGFIVMYGIALIFYKSKSLESDGTAHIKNAIDCVGTVYLPFHDDVVGVVHINMNGVMQEYDAMSYDISDTFKVGDSIKVVEVQGNLLKVVKNN